MLLAIDVGNTNTVLGCYWNKDLKRMWRISTYPICPADELRAKLYSVLRLEGIELQAIRSVIISSVVPQMTSVLRTTFKDRKLYVIDHTWPFSFIIQANPADQVGTDRLVNAEAAIREYGAPVIIVDSGTATTVCAVSKNKEYLGGAIMPGIEGAVETLARKTAKLFSIELVAPTKAIGPNTQAALQSGILLGYASMIDGMIGRFKQELKDSPIKVVATGGISERLKGLTKEVEVFDPNLTLKGIWYLYETIR